MPVLSDLGAYLVATTSLSLAYGASTGNLFLGQMPELSPDQAVALIEYPGREADRAFVSAANDAPIAEYPRIQVVIRDGSSAGSTGRAWAEAIYRRLDYAGGFTGASGTRFLNVVALQPPSILKEDESDRFVWAFNVECVKERG